MKNIKILPLLLLLPTVAFGATRGDSSTRVGVTRVSQAAARIPAITTVAPVQTAHSVSVPANKNTTVTTTSNTVQTNNETVQTQTESVDVAEEPETTSSETPQNCRDAYRQCMDEFCLLDESQGERCACSDNINSAKDKINAVLAIQEEADKLYTEGVEREQLGAKARLVFEENVGNKKISSINFLTWLVGDEEEFEDEEDIGEDLTLGDDLYKMASKYCQVKLDACGDSAEMESMLYSRMIIQDCKNYDSYLKEQKANAESNKRIAESAVRKARLEMLSTTNKYNRGECLLAYRSCIADKGGCGTNFENCLDANLLKRRSNACENILDQCMAVRKDVEKDWAAESKNVLAEANKYADKNYRATCLAKIQNCLEESCSTATKSECLNDVNVAAGICPIITECDAKIPGLQSVVNDKLGYLKTKFCENDVDKCLQDKCGVDFTKAECVGKKPYEIVALCPQDMFPSCKGATQYNIIVQSALLQMDYQMLTGCVNYFGEQLSKVCGTDMACLPVVASATAFTKAPKTDAEMDALRAKVIADSDKSVDEFFVQFEKDKTVAACADSQTNASADKKVKDKNALGTNVFDSAKMLAKMSAENRNLREMESKIAELSRTEDLETAKQNCLTTYKVEAPGKSKSNYMYIKSVAFEPSLRNCRVCRMQQVCEEGGESKATAALKAGAGGLSGGASAGTMINAGWGTAIGGIIGAVGAGVLGGLSGGKQEFCQEIESCEDINM
ncbi:MAG: hypothetical protein ACLRFP_00325 [Alphaproteobacteria bacterium]